MLADGRAVTPCQARQPAFSDATTRDQPSDDHDDRDYEQQMDETAGHVEDPIAEYPHHEQNDREGP
jgi:hypothetical protein